MGSHKVCLSFDFDAMTGMVARGLKTPTPISRGEFGAIGVERILRTLEDSNILGSWFVPGTVIKTYPELCRKIYAAGHEIGNHGWTHVPPASLSPESEESGLVRANEAIVEITGAPPAGYRSPSWDLSPVTIDLLIRHGFVYDSSMMGHDCQAYFARTGDIVHDEEPIEFGKESKLVELPVSWSLDDFPHFEYLRMPNSLAPGLANARLVLENFLADFDYMQRTEETGFLVYTFHPFVVGRGHRMELLENLIEGLKKRGAEFVRMDEVAREFLATSENRT